jgi:dTDP-4-dehydrorhamnose reductase
MLAPLGRVVALGRAQMDLTRPDALRATLREHKPDIIVNAAAYTGVDKAETEAELAMLVNARAPGVMAEEARRTGALLVHYSTDYVFDGSRTTPYGEDDAPNPLNVYGKSKLEGERAVAGTGCSHLILRTSWLYSNQGPNFVLTMLRLARAKQELAVVNDQIGSPTWARSLAESTAGVLDRIRDRPVESGIYHLSAEGYTSRYDFAKTIIAMAQEMTQQKDSWAIVRPTTSAQYPLPAVRPFTAITSKDKIKRVFGIQIPDWEAQLRNFLQEFLKSDDGRQMLSPAHTGSSGS